MRCCSRFQHQIPGHRHFALLFVDRKKEERDTCHGLIDVSILLLHSNFVDLGLSIM